VQLVNFDPNADITGAISARALMDGPSYDLREVYPTQAYPAVNRTLKGARLVADRPVSIRPNRPRGPCPIGAGR
jgi:hypothetical protein